MQIFRPLFFLYWLEHCNSKVIKAAETLITYLNAQDKDTPDAVIQAHHSKL